MEFFDARLARSSVFEAQRVKIGIDDAEAQSHRLAH
jgi:hypothetical protein